MRNVLSKIFGLCLLLIACSSAGATSVTNAHSVASIVSDVKTVKPGDQVTLMLHLKLDKGWHSYWTNPGDSGMPPMFEWQLPQGLQASDIQYLPPEKIDIGPLSNYGYSDNAYYFVNIDVAQSVSEGKYPIKLDADWLVCDKECVPEKASFEFSLTVADQTFRSEQAQQIVQLQQTMAQPYPTEVDFQQQSGQVNLYFKPVSDVGKVTSAFFFSEKEGVISNSAEQQLSEKNGQWQLAIKSLANMAEQSLSGILQLKIGDQYHSYYIDAQASTANLPTSIGFWQAILWALLGGIILNIMPCVFPILSLKALAVCRSQDKQYFHNLWHGLLYSLGIVLSFILFGLVIIALQQTSQAVGWGYQLQSPLVVAGLLYLFFVIGLNLLGVFEWGHSFSKVGNWVTGKQGYFASFATGVLAAVIATPCTAPFMGAALGYALTQPSIIALSVLVALGVGLALPILLITLIPPLARILPKPGAWMETFKQLLAFPMFLSCIWLLWVLMQQTIDLMAFLVLLGLLALSFVFWLRQRCRLQGSWWRSGIFIVLLLLSLYPLYHLQKMPTSTTTTMNANQQTFSPEKLQTLLANNQPVFVNATAAWCITCKLNEINVLNTTAVKKAIDDYQIHYLKADWTQKDDVILAYLNRFNRQGVPLYVIYNRQGDATVLPQLLTESMVINALKNADQSTTENAT